MGAARRVLRCADDAEDAAQEALVRAWRARSRCAAQERPAPWVDRIARNEALRIGRRSSERARTEGASLEDAPEPVSSPDPPAGDARPAALDGLLAQLPAPDRELIRLRYVEDLDYSAIAERLAAPLGTVKVRLHRLHIRLREATKDEGPPGDNRPEHRQGARPSTANPDPRRAGGAHRQPERALAGA